MKKMLILLMFLASSLFAIDFNTASKQELMQINGIGPKKADAIIQYRKNHKINSADDLKNVKGFNSKSVNKIKKQLKKQNKYQKKMQNKKQNMKKRMNKKKYQSKKQNMKKNFNSKKDSLKTKGKGKMF